MPETTFTSDDKPYKMTFYPGRADGKKKYPIVLLLHGNFGLTEPYGRQIKGFAESLAAMTVKLSDLDKKTLAALGLAELPPAALAAMKPLQAGLGYATAVPQYYRDDEQHLKDEDPSAHVETLKAAIAHLPDLPGVDPDRIGLIGYSLGAAIAMQYIATTPAHKVKALVDFFGPTKLRLSSAPFNPAINPGIGNFPPTITFHDAKDFIVPVDRSTELHALLPDTIDHALHVYAAEPAKFPNHAFAENGNADVHSRNQAASWLVKHLPPTAS